MTVLTPRYTGSPAGPARKQPGDALRLELRTQNGSEPQPATGRTRKFRTVLGPLQSAVPPRATPQVPSPVSSCVKWGFNACRLEGCSFSALCSMATSSLSKPPRFTAVDAAVPTGLPRLRTHTCWGPKKLPSQLGAAGKVTSQPGGTLLPRTVRVKAPPTG